MLSSHAAPQMPLSRSWFDSVRLTPASNRGCIFIHVKLVPRMRYVAGLDVLSRCRCTRSWVPPLLAGGAFWGQVGEYWMNQKRSLIKIFLRTFRVFCKNAIKNLSVLEKNIVLSKIFLSTFRFFCKNAIKNLSVLEKSDVLIKIFLSTFRFYAKT